MPEPRITVLTGPMASGKTDDLIQRLRQAEIVKLNVLTFKPKRDTRVLDPSAERPQIESRCGSKFRLDHSVETPQEMLEIVVCEWSKLGSVDVVGIEEAQFFDATIVGVVQKIAHLGIHVIISTLAKDWRGQPFGHSGDILAIADEIDSSSAVCMHTKGYDATMTFSHEVMEGNYKPGGDESYVPMKRDAWLKLMRRRGLTADIEISRAEINAILTKHNVDHG